MQCIDVQFAEQMATGDQGNGEQQQGHGQADGLTVAAQAVNPAQMLGGVGQSGGNGRFCFGSLAAHQAPR
ncbi:hypothetical protein D3C87_2069760 [compost metagenome]